MTRPAENQQTVEALARRFHETYERLAPEYGYETRRESAVPWEDVPENNRALMQAVVAEVLRDLVAQADAPAADIRRLLDAYFGDRPESTEVSIAAQRVGAWLDGAR